MTGLDPGRLAPPEGFRRTARRLERAGFEAWGVGGSLRDTFVLQLLGDTVANPPEWDLATDARPDEVMELFRRTVPVGVSHGTVRVLDGDEHVEVTTFRRDVETDGRHARVVFASSIEEDLGRRDFTVNAIAWRPASGHVRDPYGGLADIESGILRAVGDPGARFREDYLRVLRGFRFAGRFGWAVEPGTDEALREAVDGLAVLSAERVREELMKVLGDPNPSAGLDLYATRGALAHWYPELLGLAADRGAWLAALGAVDAVPARELKVRLARLVVSAADTPEGRAEVAEALLSRLRFSNADRRHVTRLSRLFLPFVGPTDSAAEHRRWLASAGEAWEDVFALHFAGARAEEAERAEQAERYLEATRERVRREWLDEPPLSLADLAVRGDDLLELGMSPGPLVRLLLEELLEQVLEDPGRNDRARLLGEAGRLIEMGVLTEASRPGGGSGGPPAGDEPPGSDA
ncbi:CCA tRNA nucleotidyltransferase [Candidatus Palauibacter sp.]|uniref:CCA tRNA nucleotidyltransferase n=1 Tax=Candidatus Palauibacter sp. TaxID=3101350 RepID=UPI003B025D8D